VPHRAAPILTLLYSGHSLQVALPIKRVFLSLRVLVSATAPGPGPPPTSDLKLIRMSSGKGMGLSVNTGASRPPTSRA